MTPEENLEEIMTGDEPSNEATPELEAPASTAPAEVEQPSETPPAAETRTPTEPVVAVKKAAVKKTASKKAALKKAATKKAAVKSTAQKAKPKAALKPAPRKQVATAAPKKTAVALKSAAKTTPVKAKAGKAKAGKPKAGKSKADKPKTGSPISTSAPKSAEPKAVKPAAKPKTAAKSETAKILESKLAYEGPLFRVMRDHIIEPGGRESYRDVIRHNGSVVILAVNPGKKKKDPWVVMERQYRHAAGQFLWELPAGKLDKGEGALEGAQRELAEETGYQAQKWTMLVEYFASPGFLGESMKIFLAEGLTAGEAHPEDDEQIDFRLVKFSELLNMVEKGKIVDGKTMISALLYARQLGVKRKR